MVFGKSSKLGLLLGFSFILRIINLNFPYFSPDEAVVATQIRNWAPFTGNIGVRLFFAVLGTFLVYLCYKFAKLFSGNNKLAFYSGLIIALSPPFIYLSKLPNLTIFYLFFLILALIIVWKRFGKATRAVLFSVAAISFLIFFQTRVFNPPLFSDSGLITNINIFRGQGLQSGWPNLVEKILFNKSHFLWTGILNWLSSISPALLFGQFDEKGIYGVTSMGAFPKSLIIPFFTGIVYLIKKQKRELKLLLFAILFLSIPSLFSYLNFSYLFIILSLLFLVLIISYGLVKLNLKWSRVVLFMAVFETFFNILIIKPEIKKTNNSRPGWIVPVIGDLSVYGGEKKIVISDDIVPGLEFYLEWYGGKDLVKKVLIVNSQNQFFRCTKEESAYALVGNRDLAYINKYIDDVEIEKNYEDFIGNKIAFKLEERICVK